MDLVNSSGISPVDIQRFRASMGASRSFSAEEFRDLDKDEDR